MDIQQDIAHLSEAQSIRKSNVRVNVTYFVVGVYVLGAIGLTVWLASSPDSLELGLGVFNGLSTMAASIAGFWFGTRGDGYPQPSDTEDAGPPNRVQTDIASGDGPDAPGAAQATS